MAIIIREVPTAFFIGILASNTRAGIIINPPPAPIAPPINPVAIPEEIRMNFSFKEISVALDSDFTPPLIIETELISKTILNKTSIPVFLENSRVNKFSSSGIAGITNFLIRSITNTEGITKNNEDLISIKPSFK